MPSEFQSPPLFTCVQLQYLRKLVEQATPNSKDPLGILTDSEWEELHKDLAEIAAIRRRATESY